MPGNSRDAPKLSPNCSNGPFRFWPNPPRNCGSRLKADDLTTLCEYKGHFLGLWTDPNITLGTELSNVSKIGWSQAPNMRQEATREGRSVGGSLSFPKVLSLNWTESVKVARSRKSPYAADAVSFLSTLHATKSVPVLLYCVSEKRAWDGHYF